METFLEDWNTKFGPGVEPPEWVLSLGQSAHQQPENVGVAISESIGRVDRLKRQLERERFVLSWLRKRKDSTGKTESVVSSRDLVNHVQEDVFVCSGNLKGLTVDRVESKKSKLVVKRPSTSSSPNFDSSSDRLVLSRSEDSPNSSEYFTAGPNSCSDTTSLSNLTEEEPSPVLIRQRFSQQVTSKDIQVAKLVRHKVTEGRHWSCLDLNQVDTDGVEFFCKPSPKARRKKYSSAPELNLEELHQKDSKRRVFSDSIDRATCNAIEAELLKDTFSPLPELYKRPKISKQQSGRDSSTLPASRIRRGSEKKSPVFGSYAGKVVLRDKSKRRRSYSMDSGGTSSMTDKRSSNGLDYLEGCNYVTSPTGTEDDEDPALINVMASRFRGTLRTPRTSTSQTPLSPDADNNGTNPENVSRRHYSASGSESAFQLPQSGEGRHVTASSFVRRRNTAESSPVKRVSYYSDDECLTPRVDPGSPFGSQGCSHRNSRNSNGILDEESPMEMTLKRNYNAESVTDHSKRKSAGNSLSPERRFGREDSEDDQLSRTLQAYSFDGKNFNTGGFNESPSDSLSKLSVDIAATLSKFGDHPEMSMAGLLDVKENRQMNLDPRHGMGLEEKNLEDLYEESIEVDEATISAFSIRNDYLCSSRSNSANSLPGLFSDNASGASSSPPDQDSPLHSSSSSSTGAVMATSVAMQGVNLRPVGAGRRRNMKRLGNADLEAMTEVNMGRAAEGGMALGGSDTDDKSVSSTSLNSEEDSSVPTSPQGHEVEESMSPDSRLSRMFPVRHSTVVVHGGEQLVIRKLVIVGVLSTEKTYIECLSVAMEYYRKPLLARTTVSQPIIQEKDINTIFYRIDDLHSLHKNLCEHLEVILINWCTLSCVGDFFVELCRNLKLYKDYVEMFQKAVECLNRNKIENPQFKKFIEDVHVTVAKTNRDIPKINELLRRPIERLQSYSLVLNDLCQHTPKDHSDYRILRESFQAMSAFIASTHDPQAFRELSGGYNRELVKEGVVVELSEGIRKVRRVFLFHDVLVSSKQKPSRTTMKFEPKWYLPLSELNFKCPEGVAKKPVPVSSEMEMSVMKNKIAELRAQVNQYTSKGERSATTTGEGFNIKRNIFMIKYGSTKQSEKVKKKLEEQKVMYWVASPSLPLRVYSSSGKQFMFLLHNEEERESWLSAIKKLQPKAVSGVSLTSFELQDLLNRQTINDLQKVEEMIIPTAEDDYLSGVLRVRVTSATDLKTKQATGLYCCLELDEYGKFERKARTLPANNDQVTLITTWDQDFEFELVGSHNLKILVCSKSLLKEETHALGKMRLPIKELKQNKRQRMKLSLSPHGVISIIIEYFSNMASVSRKTAMQSSGVFGVPIEVVAKRERHDIPLIVQTCVDEVEKRGLTEVGVYRVVGVLRDVEELRQSFDSDYLKAQMIAFDTDIHAVAGLLKRYFRELPDPLFTEALYSSFVQVLSLSEPEARAQCFHSLLHSLPPVNLKTAIFLFKHLRRVGANSSENKMTLTNLATVYGPNLLHPGNSDAAAFNMDVVTPVSVVLYYLNCPEEFFDEIPDSSPESTVSPQGGSTSGPPDNADVVVMRERSTMDASAFSSHKFKRGSRRSSTKGTPKHSPAAGSTPARSATSFKNASSSSSVHTVTPARESII